jgi:ribosome biogenesis GTPase
VARPGLVPGRVIRTSRRFTYVTTATETVPAMAAVDADPAPVAGDWVALDPGDQEGSARVAAVLERWSALVRRDPAGAAAEQVLAADVDLVFVVLGLDRPVKPGRIERSLVLAWDSGAEPVIVLTKSDVLDDPGPVLDEVHGVAGGAAVHVLSSTTGEGVAELSDLLAGDRTVVLLGESGAGKSTLLNRLAGEEVQRTAEVRAGDAKGRHTTVTRDLVVLPTGGVVIDTPGLRSLGLLDADVGLAAAYPDIEALAPDCRFRDCRHDREPGCAVAAAVADGTLDAARAARYRAMQEELDEGAAESVEVQRKRGAGREPPRRARRGGPRT